MGAKLKFLIGAVYADFSVDRMDVTMTDDAWTIRADGRLAAVVGKAQFSYNDSDDPATVDPERGPKVDGLDDYSFSLPGFGMAVDPGFTYRLLDNLTVSAALTDLGFIAWRDVNLASSRGEYTFDGFSGIWVSGENEGNKLGDQFEDLGDDLSRVFSVYDDGRGKRTQALAATLNVGDEYTMPFYGRLRVGFFYIFHQGMLAAMVHPVLWFEASLNTNCSSTGRQLGGMVSFRASRFNFYIASDRMVWGRSENSTYR